MSSMNNAATVHPAPKVSTATIPVNAPSAMQAEAAIRETLAASGRRLVEGRSTVVRITADVPASQAAITFPGSTQCYTLRVEYTK